MAKVFYCITGVQKVGTQANVGYSVTVFDTPAAEDFSSDCQLVPGMTGLQVSMFIASKVTQDVIGRGHLINVGDIISLTPIQ